MRIRIRIDPAEHVCLAAAIEAAGIYSGRYSGATIRRFAGTTGGEEIVPITQAIWTTTKGNRWEVWCEAPDYESFFEYEGRREAFTRGSVAGFELFALQLVQAHWSRESSPPDEYETTEPSWLPWDTKASKAAKAALENQSSPSGVGSPQ